MNEWMNECWLTTKDRTEEAETVPERDFADAELCPCADSWRSTALTCRDFVCRCLVPRSLQHSQIDRHTVESGSVYTAGTDGRQQSQGLFEVAHTTRCVVLGGCESVFKALNEPKWSGTDASSLSDADGLAGPPRLQRLLVVAMIKREMVLRSLIWRCGNVSQTVKFWRVYRRYE